MKIETTFKTEMTKAGTPKFPCLRKRLDTPSFIVSFTDDCKGVVVDSESPSYPVGYVSVEWIAEDNDAVWGEFYGKITVAFDNTI